MHLRALVLAVLIPIGIVSFMDRYPAMVHDAIVVVRTTMNMVM